MPVTKSMMGDKSRLQHNHHQKMRKLNDEIDALKGRQETAAKKEKEQRERQEMEHLKEMAKIEGRFQHFRDTTEENLQKLQEKIAEEENEYKNKTKEMESAIVKEIAPEAGQAIADKAISAVQASDSKVGEEQILAILSAGQNEREVAKSMAELFQTMRNQMAEDIKKQPKHEAEEEKKATGSEGSTEDKGDGYQTVGKDGRAVRPNAAAKGAAKPRDANAIIDDSPDRSSASKRAADNQLQPDDAAVKDDADDV